MPLHSSLPPQSPVTHERELVQDVLAHILPDHGAGPSKGAEACDASSNPDFEACGPLLVNVAGQIVKGQLFVIVNVADCAPAFGK